MSAQSVQGHTIPMSVVSGTGEENQPLNVTPGTQAVTCGSGANAAASRKDFRKLAICSIICGLSCIGILSLINSVKAQKTRGNDPEKALQYSQKAKTFGVISIVLWVTILIFTPILMVLVSYLLTLKD